MYKRQKNPQALKTKVWIKPFLRIHCTHGTGPGLGR